MKNSAASILCAVACGASAATMTSPLELSGVSFRQDRFTQKVHVSYSLSNQGDPAYVVMDVLTNGVSIGIEKIKTFDEGSDVSQFDGDPVAEGSGKSIVWNARKDWKGNLSSNAVVQLSACYTNRFGIYMVVDLSEGPSATRYPVSYTTMPPDFQTDISCASNKLWLKRVKAGTFLMGSPDDEVGRFTVGTEDLHEVTLTRPFYAGVFPVTVEQYRLVTGVTKSIGASNTFGSEKTLAPAFGPSWIDIRGPITNLAGQVLETWPASAKVDPASFMGLLRAKTGLDGFDLLTDAQWEYTCRAGTTTAWNNGTNSTVANGDTTSSDPNLDMLGWYSKNSDNKLHRVGQKLPNGWGFYDFHGNNWEWCLDVIVNHASEAVDPRGGTNVTGNRVQRGAAYSSRVSWCRSAVRSNNVPTAGASFRCAFQMGY